MRYRPLPPRGSIRIDDRQYPLPTAWDQLPRARLRYLARLALQGCRGWALAICCTLDAAGFRPAPSPYGHPNTLRGPAPLRLRRTLDPLAARDLGIASAFLFRDHDPAKPLFPQLAANPVPPPRGLAAWDEDLTDVRLDEFLLLLDALQALARSQDPQRTRLAQAQLLFALYRPPAHPHSRAPLDTYTPALALRLARRFAPPDRLLALWYAQSVAGRIAAAFPDLFTLTHTPDDAHPQAPPSHLVYHLAGTDLTRLPSIRRAYALDTLHLLQIAADQRRAHQPYT